MNKLMEFAELHRHEHFATWNDKELERYEELKLKLLGNQKIIDNVIKAKADMTKVITDPFNTDQISIEVAQGVLQILNHITDDSK